jgi:hypothetical protein
MDTEGYEQRDPYLTRVVPGVLSAINGSKIGSKFGRGEPFVCCDGPDEFEASERGC